MSTKTLSVVPAVFKGHYLDSGFYIISDASAGALVRANGWELPKHGWCKTAFRTLGREFTFSPRSRLTFPRVVVANAKEEPHVAKGMAGIPREALRPTYLLPFVRAQ